MHHVHLSRAGEAVFHLEITESARDDLRFLQPFVQRRILDAIAQQLPNEPLTSTRHRKPLRPNDLSAWEFTCGNLSYLLRCRRGACNSPCEGDRMEGT